MLPISLLHALFFSCLHSMLYVRHFDMSMLYTFDIFATPPVFATEIVCVAFISFRFFFFFFFTLSPFATMPTSFTRLRRRHD